MFRRAAIAGLAGLGVLTGCGNQRQKPVDVFHTVQPTGWVTHTFQRAGFSLDIPRNWRVAGGSGPLVVSIGSGLAVVQVWRYQRTEPLPTTSTELRAAKIALVHAAEAAGSNLHVIRSRVITVAGAKAIELSATERIAGQLRRDRSLHVFTNGTELVLDASAPPNEFHTVDHAVFSPMKRSLRPL